MDTSDIHEDISKLIYQMTIRHYSHHSFVLVRLDGSYKVLISYFKLVFDCIN